jgi:O-methyltransferase
MNRLEGLIGGAAGKLGLTISRSSSLQNRLPVEATKDDRAIIDSVRPFTMTSSERVWSLLQAVRYVAQHGIPGDFVECGVWRGGSVMAMARKLSSMGHEDRNLWLYDTYEGMTPPSTADVEAVTGTSAADMLASTAVGDGNNVWCVAGLDDVTSNLASTGYPRDRLRFIQGDVALTLREEVPEHISLLRLDTDWYESTKSELEILYPRLVPGGVCILDDYGHWAGARKAVDEYFEEHGPRPLMNPIDFSGRIFLKPY